MATTSYTSGDQNRKEKRSQQNNRRQIDINTEGRACGRAKAGIHTVGTTNEGGIPRPEKPHSHHSLTSGDPTGVGSENMPEEGYVNPHMCTAGHGAEVELAPWPSNIELKIYETK